jgi:hypothetical protein
MVHIIGGLSQDKYIYINDRAPGRFYASSDYGQMWTRAGSRARQSP